MSRPTRIEIHAGALLHNVARVKGFAPDKKIIAMVKANAYGCGVHAVAPVLEGQVDVFGVACLSEALKIRALGCRTPCLLVQGVFSPEELLVASTQHCFIGLHHVQQLHWLLQTPLTQPISVWIKVNTGMNRLGFSPDDVPAVLDALRACPWVAPDIGMMTHFSCADEPERIENKQQFDAFTRMDASAIRWRSAANSAAIIALPQTHYDIVRPGIMLYGISPFATRSAASLGLIPVMRFYSAISAIHHLPTDAAVGYSGLWCAEKPSVVGIVPVGYGDGYPRHNAPNTPVWISGQEVPIVGRVSMDMLAVDLTTHPDVRIGDEVELWGTHLAVERIAQSCGTIAYELLCQVTSRPKLVV